MIGRQLAHGHPSVTVAQLLGAWCWSFHGGSVGWRAADDGYLVIGNRP